jgi:hypothetical protein
MKLDRELAGVSPDSGPLPPSPVSYQLRLGQAIPLRKLAQRTKRPNIVIVMVGVFQVLFECCQHCEFTLHNTLTTEMHECRAEDERSSQPKDKFAKGVVLSKAKMA